MEGAGPGLIKNVIFYLTCMEGGFNREKEAKIIQKDFKATVLADRLKK